MNPFILKQFRSMGHFREFTVFSKTLANSEEKSFKLDLEHFNSHRHFNPFINLINIIKMKMFSCVASSWDRVINYASLDISLNKNFTISKIEKFVSIIWFLLCKQRFKAYGLHITMFLPKSVRRKQIFHWIIFALRNDENSMHESFAQNLE